jgi:hypothetical protein
MQLLFYQTALAAVTALYMVWRMYDEVRGRRERIRRRRVAYMLWVIAERMEPCLTADSDCEVIDSPSSMT